MKNKNNELLDSILGCLKESALITIFAVLIFLICAGEVYLVGLMTFLPKVMIDAIRILLVIFTLIFALSGTFEIQYYLRYKDDDDGEKKE